ncbi:hypothetical protein GCM10009555_058960 [Acrocarpospora macrocephala]|uniref:VWFA domain-containing protein n=1 Tax=Acrocarpospora macrocephala TaxID=150177 RepID=A0A5M3WV60_9ACTN|nr:hypothetical protein [Acrocarpospora macrocephala]GES11879.1 hypothetical protein Amac_054760 [Acrocarpospora macrocephala]
MMVACPVCRFPSPPATAAELACAECAWLLTGPYLAGEPSEAELAAFEEKLIGARRQRDVLAAQRVFQLCEITDADLAEAVMGQVRGGPPEDDELSRLARLAWAELPADGGPAPADTSGVAGVVADLAGGALSAVTFVELSPDTLCGVDLAVDELGAVGQVTPGWQLSWAELAPALPADAPIRHFFLAGGVGNLPAIDVDALGDLAAERIPAGSGLVLIQRTPGWPVLEAITRRIRLKHRVLAEVLAVPRPFPGVPFAETIREIVARSPLRYPYHLVVARAEPGTGEYDPVTIRLFPAGQRGNGEVRTAEVDILTPPVPVPAVTLPIVIAPAGDPAGWRLVRAVRVPVPAPDSLMRVRVELPEPGHPRVVAPSEPVDDRRGWEQLRRALPRRLSAPRVIDLVCAVELGGNSGDVVAARVTRLGDLVTAALGDHPGRDVLKVGVLSYADHPLSQRRHRGPSTDPVVSVPLSEPAAAMKTLRGLRASSGVAHAYATALEDALKALTTYRWRPGSHRVAVFAGARPAHRAAGSPADGVASCPIDWSEQVRKLRDQGVRCVAIVEPTQWEGLYAAAATRHADRVWAALAGDAVFGPGDFGAPAALHAAGLSLSEADRGFPFALAAGKEHDHG